MACPCDKESKGKQRSVLKDNEKALNKRYRDGQKTASTFEFQDDSGTEDKADPAKPPPATKSNSKPNGITTAAASERATAKPRSTSENKQKPNGTITISASKRAPVQLQPTLKSTSKPDETTPGHKAINFFGHFRRNPTRGSKTSSQHSGSGSKVIEAQEVEVTNVAIVTPSGRTPGSKLVEDLEVTRQISAGCR